MNVLFLFFKKNVVEKLISFLKQGVSPQKLALSISVAIGIGVFPILGTHTGLSFLAIFLLGLNPAVVFLVTNLVFPLFFVFVIPFVRIGENICAAPHLPLSVEGVTEMLQSGILNTIETLGMTLVYGFVGWAVALVPMVLFCFYILKLLFAKISTKIANPNDLAETSLS